MGRFRDDAPRGAGWGDGVNGLALFAGVAGIELGLHVAIPGYRTLGYVERDAYAAAALVARMEDAAVDQAPVWDDVSTFDGRPYRGRVDIAAGGFPCQDISLAGSGDGIDGEQSGLWSEFDRIICDVGPRFVFVENVAALATRGLDRVLGDLAESGFDAEWDVFSAAGVGAPHLRRRMFILAKRVSDPLGNSLRIEPERGEGRAQAPDERDALARHMGEAVADGDGDGWKGFQQAGSTPGAVGRRAAPMGDPDRGLFDGERSKRGGDVDRYDREGLHLWPPGPGDAEGWRHYLSAGGPEPALRRGADGLSYRMDRLRCLGNGVVPLVAAYAFRTLAARLGVEA